MSLKVDISQYNILYCRGGIAMSDNSKVKVTIKDNGPIRIEGEIVLCDGKGNEYDLGGRSAISICRCDNSKTLPFCDGSHNGCGFQSEVAAYALPPKK